MLSALCVHQLALWLVDIAASIRRERCEGGATLVAWRRGRYTHGNWILRSRQTRGVKRVTRQLNGLWARAERHAIAECNSSQSINQKPSYLALAFDRSSWTVFTDGCCAAATVVRDAAVALFERRLSSDDADVLLLLTLSKSLNRGVIPVVGRTTFCLKPKRLPRAAAVACIWSRLGGCKRGVVRPVVSLSPLFCSPKIRCFMFYSLAFHTVLSVSAVSLSSTMNVVLIEMSDSEHKSECKQLAFLKLLLSLRKFSLSRYQWKISLNCHDLDMMRNESKQ